MKTIIYLSVLLFVISASCLADPIEDKNDKALRQIVEDFRTALIEKDEAKFVKLFYDKSIPWIGIEQKENTGDLPSNSGVQQGNQLSFIAWIARVPERVEEKFWDITVQTDGLIAAVSFKYSFHLGDYKSNWGEEYWQLIKTNRGWKINSVIYSVINNPEPRKE